MIKPDNKCPEVDPRGLIYESFRIEDVTMAQCRSIFFDWAMGDGGSAGKRNEIEALLSAYSDEFPDHPMTKVLREGQGSAASARRRGGWRARRA